MVIEKILNNNVVVTKDENQAEIVVMGKGLAFNKKPGDFILKEKIDKIFKLSDHGMSQKFQELAHDIPLEYLTIAFQIIDYAKEKLNKSLNESIYLSLTDHLYTAIERTKNNIQMPNVLLWDIKRLFPEEFEIGKRTVEKIKEGYGVQLSEDEAGFIALHIVNAQTENPAMDDMYAFTKTLQDIINIVRYYYKIDINEESVYFYRFTTHLRFFLSRVVNNTHHEGEVEEELLSIVQKKYGTAVTCVEKIQSYLTESFDYHMSSDEKMYLAIHIARLADKNR
ncbi:transcription antiterminator LicT [Enterococcus sp. JM4C]|uniref:BglG family transcription antiterminator LicT n=1 Tax=Candidatus Enterococcus huntleyi TaxID=1857217 RepID=UPI001379F3D1|nr:PRD domain-containing protein [Enterococcus sp. JM4C]KAF1295801.1 transcription antiterminator LicT [Enterococcus sp. JM4C]